METPEDRLTFNRWPFIISLGLSLVLSSEAGLEINMDALRQSPMPPLSLSLVLLFSVRLKTQNGCSVVGILSSRCHEVYMLIRLSPRLQRHWHGDPKRYHSRLGDGNRRAHFPWSVRRYRIYSKHFWCCCCVLDRIVSSGPTAGATKLAHPHPVELHFMAMGHLPSSGASPLLSRFVLTMSLL